MMMTLSSLYDDEASCVRKSNLSKTAAATVYSFISYMYDILGKKRKSYKPMAFRKYYVCTVFYSDSI